MHIDKQVTLSILIMLVPREAPRQAKVEGLWLTNKHCVPEYTDNS